MAIVKRRMSKNERATKLVRSARQRYVAVKSQSKPYFPSIGNVATSVIGGGLAGLVESGATPIPPKIANISTPLILGGVLATFGIYSSGQKGANPMVAKTASNLGSAMLACWMYEFAQDQIEKTQTTSEA